MIIEKIKDIDRIFNDRLSDSDILPKRMPDKIVEQTERRKIIDDSILTFIPPFLKHNNEILVYNNIKHLKMEVFSHNRHK